MFNLLGEITAPFSTNGSYQDNMFSVSGKPVTPTTTLNENFNNISSELWGFDSGIYRTIYLPLDYSENAFIMQGKMIIANIKNNPYPGYVWSGAFANTKNKFAFRYGTIIARIKFSEDQHYHATLWTLSEAHGEIDIAECDSGNVSCNLHMYHRNGDHFKSETIAKFNVIASEYHIYQLIWTAQKIKAYVDGKLCGIFDVEKATIDGFNSLREQHYLIIDSLPYSTASDQYSDKTLVQHEFDFIKIYTSTM